MKNVAPAPEAKSTAVPLTLRDIEMAIYGLKIWRQVMVAQTFAEFRKGRAAECQEVMVDIDVALEKFEQAVGK